MNKKKIECLYLILDQRYAKRDIVSIAAEAIEGGVDVIQYREKVLSTRDALNIAKRLRDLTEKCGGIFIVNDDPALALAVDADGVHLGQGDIPVNIARKILGKGKIIGLSTHSIEDAAGAVSLGVDYIGFGPIFPSKTKMVASPLGINAIGAIRDTVPLPIIAIGGIDQSNVKDVIKGGADGAAVISSILSATDIKEAVSEFKKRIREGRCAV